MFHNMERLVTLPSVLLSIRILDVCFLRGYRPS
jgi:hypothetical protein